MVYENNFNVKIKVDYNFEEVDINKTKLNLTYYFELFEGSIEHFGSLECTYEFFINEAYQFITFNEDTENTVVREYMKINGENVRKLIITKLQNKGITLNQKSYLN